MTATPKTLFRGAATTDTSTVLYTVPAATTAVVTNIVVTNTAQDSGSFTMSFDDFVISYFASSGSAVKNISIYLYTLKRGIEPTINALSTLIILVIGMKITFDYFKTQKNLKEEDE